MRHWTDPEPPKRLRCVIFGHEHSELISYTRPTGNCTVYVCPRCKRMD